MNGRLHHRRPATAAAFALALLACAPGRVQLRDLAEHPRPTRVTWSPGREAPQAWFAKVIDVRIDQPAPGTSSTGPLAARELGPWLDGDLATLNSADFIPVTGAEPPPAVRLQVRPRLVKAYLDGAGVTKTAVVVLSVEIQAAGGAPIVRSFRGQHASMNWADTVAERAGSLQDAAGQCLELLRMDLEALLHPGQPGRSRPEPPDSGPT